MDINELITENSGLVYGLLKQFGLWNDPEALSIALEALGRAISHFDEKRDIRLSTFAHCCIYNALGCYVRELLSKKNTQLTIVSYDRCMEDGRPFLDTIASKIDIESEITGNEFKRFLAEAIVDICNTMRGKKQKIVLAWKERDFCETSVELAKQAGCSQSYASEAMNTFRGALRKRLEEYRNA